MKRAISISLGSSKRDKQVTIKFKNEEILVERVGTNGDLAKARQMFLDLDGKWMPSGSAAWTCPYGSMNANTRCALLSGL